MARQSLRRYDVQARYSVILSAAAIVPLLGALTAAIRNYKPQLRVIMFGDKSLFEPALLLCILAAMGLSVLGLILGFNSAGQRRNDQQQKSWTGFFMGAAIFSLSIIVASAYWLLKHKVPTG